VSAVSAPIPVEELQSNALQARLVYASSWLGKVVFPSGEEAYICPWDLVVLFRGRLGVYRITVPNWESVPPYRAWCDAGCNHFYVYVMRRDSDQAKRVRVDGKRVYAVLDGPTVRFVIASRTKGVGAPWKA
jgi:hypothetical protein